MKKFLFLVVAALAGMSAFAGEVYVAMNGVDDEGRGTSDAPFASVAYAVSSLGADGGTVWVGEGTYTVAAWIQVTTPVKIAGLGDEPTDTILRGDGKVPIIKLNHDGASLENLTIENGYHNRATDFAPGLTVTKGTVTGCVIRDCKSDGNWSIAASIYQSGGLIQDCIIENGQHNNLPADYANYHPLGAYLHGTATMKRCLFRNFNSSLARGTIVHLGSSNALLENCTIVDASLTYRKDCPGMGVYAGSGTVRNCAIIGVRRAGSTVGGTANLPGLAPWGGKEDCFVNCVTDAEGPINNSCFVVPTDCAFRDYTAKDYTPAPGGVLATQGIGCYANTKTEFDAAFGVDRYVGPTGEEFVFTAFSANASGSVTYQWDFDGDGTYDTEPSASASVNYAYTSAGAFSPVLKASDGTTVLEIPRTDLVTVAPAIIYVDAKSADPVSPYTDPMHAAKTIADAVAVANDGSEVRVASGLYKVTGPFTLSHGIRVVGADGDLGRTIVSNTTTGSGIHNLAVLDHPDAFVGNISFQKGFVTTCPNSAAGVTIESNGGTVSNCVITACKSDNNQSQVGGAYLKGGLLTHSIVENCYQDNGERMGSGQRKAGGALVAGWGKVSNTLFRKMPTGGYGHVVWVASSVAEMENCTVVDSILSSENKGANLCYGVYIENGTVRNCAMFGISRIAVGSTPATDYAAWGGKADNFIACATDGDAAINSTCFLSTKESAFSNYETGDLTPSPGQGGVLFDHGATVASAPTTDLAGKDRVSGDAIDIGAYEFQSAGLVVDFSASIVKGTAPVDVTFSATVIGASGTVTYDWDFNGDGVYEREGVTTDDVTYRYTTAGVYTVSVRAHDSAQALPAENTKPDFISLAPAVVFVDRNSTTAASPFATPETAASNIVDALAVAYGGSVISVAKGWYPISSTIKITEAASIVGETGNPSDVVISNTVNGSDNAVASLNNAAARIANVSLFGGRATTKPTIGVGLTIELGGGTVSNCVIANCSGGGNQLATPGAYLKSGLLTHSIVENCRVDSDEYYNTSGLRALGAVVTGDGRVENSLFRNFKSNAFGHVVLVASSAAKLINCTVVDSALGCDHELAGSGNKPTFGIYCAAGSVVNCAAFGISRSAFDSTPATEFAAWGGTAEKFDHCATDGEEAINESCYIADKTKDVRNYANGDYRPAGGGALVNHGVMPPNVPSVDLSGRPRVFDKFIDIGCYECSAGGLLLIVR